MFCLPYPMRILAGLRFLVLLAVYVGLVLHTRTRLRLVLDDYFRGDTLATPDLRGYPFEEAQRALAGTFVLEAARRTHDPKVPEGHIISQEPPPGIQVRAGKTLFLRVSKGADLQAVPELSGLDLRKASIAIRNAGLQVGAVCYLRDRARDPGAVIDQAPEPGAKRGRGDRVDLLVASAPDESSRLLPRVVGAPRTAADRALREAGATRIHVEAVESSLAEGTVLGQAPPAGTMFEADAAVSLQVAAPIGSGEGRKTLELVYALPAGLAPRGLVVAVRDLDGRRVVHDSRHLPGERVAFVAGGRGQVRVEYFLDDLLVSEEVY